MENFFEPQLNLSSPGPQRNLVFCFDGTWNDPEDLYEPGGDITNVLKIHRYLVQDDKKQMSFYFRGVGTKSGLDKIIGGATGSGANKIRNQGYVRLITQYRPGDRIFVFGFSRGAAIARLFANLVEKEGIPERIEFNEDSTRFKPKGKSVPVSIEMLGLFDTVGSFGIPINLGINFQKINLFKDLDVPSNVKQAYHLLSLYDARKAFFPSLMNVAPHIEEIWFAGVHSDIGGGYADQGISDIALQFMVDCSKAHGLIFDEAQVKEVKPTLTGTIHDFVKEEYSLKLEWRPVFVLENDKPSSRPPKIHHTVIDRIKRLGTHIPANLERLGEKYEVVGPDYFEKKKTDGLA